jgi:hypothetical protein
MVNNKQGQIKIQQMMFMIIGLFIFFGLVGLFFIRFQLTDLDNKANDLNKEQTITFIKNLANLPELHCNPLTDYCIDEDKINVLAGEHGEKYKDFWPIASIRILNVQEGTIHEVYDNGQTNKQEYGTYINLCKTVKEQNYVYERCELAKLLVGVKNNE